MARPVRAKSKGLTAMSSVLFLWASRKALLFLPEIKRFRPGLSNITDKYVSSRGFDACQL